MSDTVIIDRGEQATLLDLSSKLINPYWIDPMQPLQVPKNPLHHKAHELQILLAILKKQAEKNPAQFNSRNYIDTLREYTKSVTAINNGDTIDEVHDSGGMDETSTRSKAAPVGAGASSGVDLGISPDNPFTG